MSIIAVKNLNFKATLPFVVKALAKTINGQFEALNFGKDNQTGGKLCYLRLSRKLDPQQVVERINKNTKFGAFIPKRVPDLPPASSKRGKIPFKLRRALHLPTEVSPDQVFVTTHNEILTELQSKYTGLYNLSKKTGHKLLDSIAETIFERLKQASDSNPDALETGFKLSKCYRRLHPHFGDFQLILSTLHRLQDAAGVARSQIVENELTGVAAQPQVIENLPYNKVQSACTKYADRIIKKVSEYVEDLKTKPIEGDSEEDLAKKKVREELLKLTPYLPTMIKQVITQHFVPQKLPFHRIRIYGEPFLPTKEQIQPLVSRHKGVNVRRSDRMYNVLRFSVPLPMVASLLSNDGTVIGTAKLVIRSSDIPLYKAKESLIAKMKASFGVEHEPGSTKFEEDWPIEEDEDEEEMAQAV